MKKIQGFSLLELMMTFALIAILVSIAIPSYHYFIHSKKVKLTIHQIIHGIQYARSTAIHESRLIDFCGSDNDNSCDGKWDAGQMVISPNNGKVFRYFPAISKQFHLTWQSSFGKNQKISFNALGFTHGQQGHFALYQKKDNRLIAKIIIVGTGRIRVEQ